MIPLVKRAGHDGFDGREFLLRDSERAEEMSLEHRSAGQGEHHVLPKRLTGRQSRPLWQGTRHGRRMRLKNMALCLSTFPNRRFGLHRCSQMIRIEHLIRRHQQMRVRGTVSRRMVGVLRVRLRVAHGR